MSFIPFLQESVQLEFTARPGKLQSVENSWCCWIVSSGILQTFSSGVQTVGGSRIVWSSFPFPKQLLLFAWGQDSRVSGPRADSTRSVCERFNVLCTGEKSSTMGLGVRQCDHVRKRDQESNIRVGES